MFKIFVGMVGTSWRGICRTGKTSNMAGEGVGSLSGAVRFLNLAHVV